MFGKRKPVVKFFDISTFHVTDSQFGLFLAEAINLVRDHRVAQFIMAPNKGLDYGYIQAELKELFRRLGFPHEKFSVISGGSERAHFVEYTMRLKRKFLGLFWF